LKDAAQSVHGFPSSFGLHEQGFRRLAAEHWNLSVPILYEHAIRRGEGRLGAGGSFVAVTGAFTGRTPKDKYIVEEASSKADIDWNATNQKLPEATFDSLHRRILSYYQGREMFVQDLHCGADPAYRLKVRVATPSAWHAHRRHRICRRDQEVDLHRDELHAAAKGVLPMHCSANVGPEGDVALFFGLSGTGKTTLSADPQAHPDRRRRARLGRRTACSISRAAATPRCINLSPEAEPEIYAATHRFGTVLENVVIDPHGAGPRRRRVADREHPRLLSGRFHPERRRPAAPASRRTSSC
jgi:phosphoenolpyruvate carboxykinase (ATP)